MELIVVCVSLEVVDHLLPVGRQNVFVSTVKALIDLLTRLVPVALFPGIQSVHLPMHPCKIQ